MDELPDLQSDADVDALMARLRAKVVPPPAAAPEHTQPSTKLAATDDAIRDLVAAQDAFAATVVRAMHVITEAFEDLDPSAQEASTPKRARPRGGKQMTPVSRRRPRRRVR